MVHYFAQSGKDTYASVGSELGESAKIMLDEYMKKFEKRNPNLKVFNAVMHLDEASPHIHLSFVPVAKNENKNRGLSLKNSMVQALAQQGIVSEGAAKNERTKWIETEKEEMAKILKTYGHHKKDENVEHRHLEVDEYKRMKDLKREKEKLLSERMTSLKKLKPEEIKTIQQQNISLLRKTQSLDNQLKSLEEKSKDDFIFIEIVNENKLQFIIEKLRQHNLPFVEDRNGLHYPKWIQRKIYNFINEYKPVNLTWRDTAMLDIDRLIYSVKTIDELWEALETKGYEIKLGKYISIKPEGAERAVRTKSLGIEYTLESLTRRIENNRNYERGCDFKIKSTSGIEKEMYVAVKNITVLFYNKRKYPNKTDKNKPFTITNDRNINELTNCLALIKSQNIKSLDDLQSRREKCSKNIAEAQTRIKKIEDMHEKLDDLREKVKFYFNRKDTGKQNSMQEMRLAVAKETLEAYEIHSKDDLASVDDTYTKYILEKEELLISLEKEKAKLESLSKLSEICEQVQDGSYMKNLLKQESEAHQVTESR